MKNALRLIVIAAWVVFVSAPLQSATPDSRPNILFIMSDDHAAHALSSYGSRINKTPQLDRIAAGGMRFNHCFAVNSICTPSRATILTGKYSHLNGVPAFNRFDGSQPHVARMLKSAGYHTAMIGKWHLGSDPTGFDYWNILPGQGLYHDPVFIEKGERKKHVGYASDLITEFSLQALKDRPKDKPFFMMVHHKAPHRPWEPSPKYTNLYEDVEIPEPATFNDQYETRASAAREATMRIDRDLTRGDLKLKPPPGLAGPDLNRWRQTNDPQTLTVSIKGKDVTLTGEPLKKWKYQKYIKDYLRCVASVDDGVGRLLDFLDEQKLSENTVVIYTSDQGFFLGDHNWFDKRFMYEESIRMPFLVRYPARVRPGSVNERMVLNVDFAPTFLELAGAKVPSEMQGKSLVPLLTGASVTDWRTAMYYRYYHYPADHKVQPHYGVRTETHKLIYFNKVDEWELFDLRKDPRELKNVYQDPGYTSTVTQLKKQLQDLRVEYKDEDQFADKLPPPF